jgi:hypothetical protein
MGELAILGFPMIIIFPMGASKSIYNPMDNKRQKLKNLVSWNYDQWRWVEEPY